MSTIPTLSLDLRLSYERPEDMRIPNAPQHEIPAMTTSTVGPVPGPRNTGLRAKPKPRVLILGRILAEEEVHAELESVARVHNVIATADLDVPSAIQHAALHHGPFEAVGAVFSSDPFPWRYGPAQFSPLAPHTKLYANPGAGYDTVDVDWITSTGAYFANAPLEVGRRTADATISLILTITRGLSTQFLHARAGKWKDPSIKALDWRGKTLGILGLGNIGSQVADMATGLGFKVIYSNRHQAAGEPYDFVSREELFKRADVLLLLTPLTDETRGLINKKTIAELKDGVIIVNVSRGPVVVEQDLVDALKSGKVLRAALDVFEHEPEIHPDLLVNPNVLITPHVAAFTEDISIKSANEVFENIIQFLRTGKPNTPVNDPEQ